MTMAIFYVICFIFGLIVAEILFLEARKKPEHQSLPISYLLPFTVSVGLVIVFLCSATSQILIPALTPRAFWLVALGILGGLVRHTILMALTYQKTPGQTKNKHGGK